MTRLHKNVLEEAGGAAVEFEGETAVVELGGITLDIGQTEVFLEAICLGTLAAETGGTTFRIRRGKGTGGTEVLKVKVTGTGGKEFAASLQVRDLPGQCANLFYTLTMAEAKAGSKPKAESSRLKATF